MQFPGTPHNFKRFQSASFLCIGSKCLILRQIFGLRFKYFSGLLLLSIFSKIRRGHIIEDALWRTIHFGNERSICFLTSCKQSYRNEGLPFAKECDFRLRINRKASKKEYWKALQQATVVSCHCKFCETRRLKISG